MMSAIRQWSPKADETIIISSSLCMERGDHNTAVSSEAWAKLRDWASVASRGRLLLSGSIAHASLKTQAVLFLRCRPAATTLKLAQNPEIRIDDNNTPSYSWQS